MQGEQPLRDWPGYFVCDGEIWSAWTRGPNPRIADRPLRKLAVLPRGLVRLYRDRERCEASVKRLIREVSE